jgi:predicted RNA-binding protein with PIN domain
VAYLIDGNNFIGYASPGSLKDPQAKYRLVSRLLIFQRLKKTRILLVFDGAPDLNLIGETFQKKKFSVIFPPFGGNADKTIKEIILKQTDLRRFFVVSSDREIKRFAQSKRAHALSSKEFSRELQTALKEHKKSLEIEKKVTSLSPLEMNQWLKIFKDEK